MDLLFDSLQSTLGLRLSVQNVRSALNAPLYCSEMIHDYLTLMVRVVRLVSTVEKMFPLATKALCFTLSLPAIFPSASVVVRAFCSTSSRWES